MTSIPTTHARGAGQETTIPTSPQQNKFFDTAHLKADLKGRSVRGGAVTMIAQGAKFFLQMGSTVILARLLTPQDFGLIAMVTAATGLVAMFKDMGLSMATVQRAEINHAQISTLFWINVAISLVIMMVTVAVAPAIAWFYDEPRLTWITIALSTAFIFTGITIQHQALLRRQMRFGILALIEIISMLVGTIIAVISAMHGAGYWALVLMQLAVAISTAMGVLLSCRWCPGLPVRNSDVRSMLTFGGHLTGFNVFNYFSRNIDNILIGWCWGAKSLGLYAKAYSLLMFPLQQINFPISAVAIPTLSRLQDDPERYRKYYLNAVSIIAFVTMPAVMFMIVMSDEIIWLLLGPKWSETSRIFMVLGIAGLFQPITSTTGWVFVSLGRTLQMAKFGLLDGTIAILSILAGLPWGGFGVAISYATASVLIRTPLIFWFIGRQGPIRALDFYRAFLLPGFISVGVLLSLLPLRQFMCPSHRIANILIAFVLASGITVLILISLKSGKRLLGNLREFGRSFKQPMNA